MYISDVVRIGSMIIFHLSKLWKGKFFILCDVIFLVRLQEKFEIVPPGGIPTWREIDCVGLGGVKSLMHQVLIDRGLETCSSRDETSQESVAIHGRTGPCVKSEWCPSLCLNDYFSSRFTVFNTQCILLAFTKERYGQWSRNRRARF